jgi:lipoate-protein ligase A
MLLYGKYILDDLHLMIIVPNCKCIDYGINTDINEEVDLKKCYENDIVLLRRFSARGTIYFDGGTFTSCLTVPLKLLKEHILSIDIDGIYRDSFINTLKYFNINAFKRNNDLINITGQKMFGGDSVTTELSHIYMCSLLFNPNFDDMFKYMKKYISNHHEFDNIEDAKEKLTCVKKENNNIDAKLFIDKWINNVGLYFDCECIPYNIPKNLYLKTKEVAKIFASNDWIFNTNGYALNFVKSNGLKRIQDMSLEDLIKNNII